MKNFIKSLNLRLSDLLFIIGFFPMAVFLIFGQLFMQYKDPNDVALKLWAIIPLFIIMLICWGLYIYLEHKRNNLPKRYISYIFIALAIIGLISILTQPSNFDITMVNSGRYAGRIDHIAFKISSTHYFFFICELMGTLLLVYIGLFILPKRFTGIQFLRILGYAVFLFIFSVIIYSYFAEYDKYVYLLQNFDFSDKGDRVADYAVSSYVLHKNAFGMIMMIGIICCFINHSIEQKWFYYPLAFYFYISILASYCKTALLISLIIAAIYVIYRLIVTFNEHKKRNIIIISIIGGIAVIGIGLVGISYITEGKFLGKIYEIIQGLTNERTISSRNNIWDNTYLLIAQSPLYFFFGRGFGLVNLMLLPMNMANGDSPMAFPTHSSYLNMFAEGGIFYLIALLALLFYYALVVIKCFKKDPNLAFALALGTLSFLGYSLIETIHYLAYVFMFLSFVHYHILYGNKDVLE